MRSINRSYLIAGVIACLILLALLPGWIALPLALAAVVLSLLFGLGETAWQLFKDARWLFRWIAQRFKRGPSDGRTTPDRSGQ